MTSTEIADIIHQSETPEQESYLFIGGISGNTHSAFRLRKNSLYNLVFWFISKYPEYAHEIQEASNDFIKENLTAGPPS